MIGFLDGRVAGRIPDGCLLEVGGVGYRLSCPTTTLASLPADGGRARLFTHLHVREDALALFGFGSESERATFEALLSVSGVGPRVALQICSAFAPPALRVALLAEDVGALASVSGVGRKTAQRLVLELKEKLDLPEVIGDPAGADALAQARSALENLGYSAGEVRAALGEIEAAPDDGVEEVVKSALKVLA